MRCPSAFGKKCFSKLDIVGVEIDDFGMKFRKLNGKHR